MKTLYREPSHHPAAVIFLMLGALVYVLDPWVGVSLTRVTVTVFSGMVFFLGGISELLPKTWVRTAFLLRLAALICLFISIVAFTILVYQSTR